MLRQIDKLLITCCLTALTAAQSSPGPGQLYTKESTPQPNAGQQTHLHLTRIGVVDVPSVMTHTSTPPFKCDSDGNIYFLQGSPNSTIQKLSPKGEPIAMFHASPYTDKKLDHAGPFDVALNGELYELVFPHEFNRYVFTYKSNGNFKAAIKLNTGFMWFPSHLAVFPSGQMLIQGSEYDKDVNAALWPFTGIFAPDGNLLKEVKLEDDETLHDMAAVGDSRVSSEVIPQGNKAVDFTQLERAPDGNVYLMRWTNPAIIYAISPGGEVVRRLKIDPGDARYYPRTLHVFKNRLAILFLDQNTFEKTMKIVDLEGHEIATYDEPRTDDEHQRMLSSAFYCYNENPTRFVFLGTNDDGRLQFVTVEPR